MATQIAAPPKARLIEVFSAIQGEGMNVGTRQIFIRFALCDLRCHFCDSAHTWSVPEVCQIEKTPGWRDFETHPNPVMLTDLLSWVERQNQPGLHDSISLTGGEPLLSAPFLVQFLPEVRSLTDLPIYLETGGHRPEQLSQLLPYLDSIGMDIKLPSVSGENRWQAHQEFLQLCGNSQLEVFVKIIISSQTNPAELEQAGELVASVNPAIPIFLQPVTALPGEVLVVVPAPDRVLEWQALMKRFVKQVRVIPQTHKMMNQL
ncbi:7-carboxy-7-deazaguanine synthase QueE [Planktothrix sp. FACHB-1355]|uniref:7-carboxy-7-deazaguanine synthase n=1 Tax=Aerosakkonema funiforme FACHB-1375 TaxID=2949571 RepID=A0A926VC32_9CYAN|nr:MULTISPECIES: 7-carboxy-7-deazaguanine synthase QueE [Oscillatoriales]MBD2181126.1 7-carboxy-7-deazaguanine synthase QueE [Aerosakkonema funiforme FACHB-1375]MBD3560274.1 7-carboxy-7-deazaguanine synthase QueE [Planktothrix sp. FACHB-1355]